MKSKVVETFLRESNAIESVYDDESYNTALQAWEFVCSENELHVDIIFEAHRLLMVDKLWPSQIGCFRRANVRVGSQVLMDWSEVPSRMSEWVANVNNSMKFPRGEDDNEQMSRYWHVKFEMIHPFVDGNGRIGRILMNWWRVMVGLPILVIYEKDKLEYYKWFEIKEL